MRAPERFGEKRDMYQFFVEEDAVFANGILIAGADVNHIRNVLRMKPGEQIRVSTSSGENYLCRISEFNESGVLAEIAGEMPATELSSRIVLYQGLPKSDKFEFIIQKAVELGAAEIVPVAMKNCVAKPDEKKVENKRKRWQSIAESAAKQSKRSVIPSVHGMISFRDAVEAAAAFDIGLVCYENERGMSGTRAIIEAIRPGQSIAVFIGPEGGFDASEIALAKEAGMRTVSLGNRILRTETAGLAMLSVLMYHVESLTEDRRET